MLDQVDLYEIHIFNRNKFGKNIKDGTLGFLLPEPLGEDGPFLHYFLLGDDTLALIPWLVKPNHRRRECIWNPSKQIQGHKGNNGTKAKGCQRHCYDICSVAQHAGDTPRWTRQGSHLSR